MTGNDGAARGCVAYAGLARYLTRRLCCDDDADCFPFDDTYLITQNRPRIRDNIQVRRSAPVSRSQNRWSRHTPADSAAVDPPPRHPPTRNRCHAPAARYPNPVDELYYFE